MFSSRSLINVGTVLCFTISTRTLSAHHHRYHHNHHHHHHSTIITRLNKFTISLLSPSTLPASYNPLAPSSQPLSPSSPSLQPVPSPPSSVVFTFADG